MIIIIILLTAIYPVSASETQEAVRIAVIDTGIAEKHSMLDTTHIAQGKNYVFPEGGTDDLIGHGTRIAGLILGSTDGKYPGTAPDAVDKYHCQVINLSSGVSKPDDTLYKAICYAMLSSRA